MAAETPSGPTIVEASAETVVAAFSERDQLVVTLSGYSGSGYEDEDALMRRARALLGEYDPASTIINIGATAVGIGAVYEIASEMGFETTGIVSSQALESEAVFSPSVDRVYVVADDQWGGLIEGTDVLSPTSEAIVAVSDVYLAIGGGAAARDEAVAARARGKEVRFFPADLDRRRAIERAEARGEPVPTDFRGAAHQVLGEGSGAGG
ncbi:MAG TPA: hypothetical protein VK858_10090 [Longimicrobiales bacterium]|nr:hypothetical protein [Longimicrobiales bacterium]